VILLQHMRDVSRIAQMAHGTMFSNADFRPDLIHATGGLLVLFTAMALFGVKALGHDPLWSASSIAIRAKCGQTITRFGISNWQTTVGTYR